MKTGIFKEYSSKYSYTNQLTSHLISLRSLVAMLGNTYYDVLDEHSDNMVRLQGLKRMMNVFRVPEEAAYTFFERADTEGTGSVPRDQLHDHFQKFWLDNYNPEYDDMYAYKY